MRTTKNGLRGLMLRGVALLMLLLGASLPARGQDYVFLYKDGNTVYFLRNNNGTIQAQANFGSYSSSCIWTGSGSTTTLSNGNYYLYRNTNTLQLYTNYSSNWNITTYGRVYYDANTDRYIRYNNGWTSLASSNNPGTGVAYTVLFTYSNHDATLSDPSITGTNVLTATGTSDYSVASKAKVQYHQFDGYSGTTETSYYWYNNALQTSAPTETNVTSGTWSLTGNTIDATTYASVNTSTGRITVSSIPPTDLTMTLSCTVTGNGINKTATKTVHLLAENPSAPVISLFGTSQAQITCPSQNVTIYYTTNGNTPTESSTEYSGPFDINCPSTTVKAIAVRNGHSSTTASITLTCKVPMPVITLTGANATIAAGAGSPDGTKLYYTTDGNTPTSSSTEYTGGNITLTNPQTIKVIAIKSGYDNSDIASAEYIVEGISGSLVILDDREDHSWTYYSGVDNCVDGGNYNTNYLGKLYSPNPRNVKITYNGVNDVDGSSTTVKVSRTENETSFIYYKTLEEGTTSGEYPYQVISNPFSVRPSKGTGNSKVYYGFAGWKIVSGGDYIKNHSNNDVLALDEEIVFENLPYSSVNCISAEIVFQTTWTTANVQTGDNISTMLSSFSGGTYETNFAVLTGQYTTAWTGNKNATITSVYPDGSSDVRSDNNYTRLNVTVNANYTIKYEYININNSNTTFSMGTGTKTLYIGRGVSNTDANGVVCNVIRGYDGSINSGGLTYTMKIESGIYNYLSFIKGYDGARTDNTVTGTVAVKGVLGCDYDRAREDNTKLKIQQQIMMGYANNTALLNSTTAGQEVLNVTLKSGNLISSRTDAGTADAAQSFYIGIAGQYSAGYRVFTMEGGEMWSLAAGICNNTQNTNSIRFRIKGGLIKGSIYGSAANADSYGYKQMIITGGTIKGWIAGGGNGTSANGGTTTGSSYIYVGGNARVDSEGSNTKINSSLGGQVFGSGSGVENTTTWGEMMYGSNVVIADNAYIERNVFGGGNFGWTDQYATIYLTGDKMSVGNVYGGANQNKGDNVKIYMTGGTVREGLYGGSNSTGTIQYNVEMHIDGGQVGTNSQNANIHGGGYGSATRVSQNVEITLGNSCNDTEGVTVFGDVYGGSALGYVNGTSANNTYHTYVTLNKGTINGSLYGGGLGNANTAANVYGPVQVKVYGGSVKKTDANGANGSGAVYGCNNTNGAPQRAVSVDIYGTDPAPAEGEYGLFAVYGGGNQANYSGTPNVTVHCGDPISIGDVYGGGNAATVTGTNVAIYGGNVIGNVYAGANAANVNGAALANIYGGTLGRVFAGNNNSGNITGGATVNINSSTETDYDHCPLQVGAVFHGGNQAPSAQQTVNIICTGDATEGIDTLFGGANAANITGDVTLNVNRGNIRHAIFGGNNAANSINGDITVTLGTDNTCQYPFPTVFGGGFGANTSSTGDVTVTVGDKAGTQQPTVNGDIYGGSALGSVNDAAADNTIVNIYNGTVNGNVYGGGLGEVGDASKGTVNGVVTVNIGASDQTDGNCHSDLSNCSVYGCNNTNGSPQQNVTVNIYRTGHTAKNLASYHDEADSAFAIDQVFGGGNQADFTPSGKTATVHIYGCNNTIRRVFGGGNAAAATGVVTTIEGGRFGWVFGGGNGEVTAANIGAGGTHLTVQAGRIEHLFGASNANGTITGAMITNVNHDNDGCEELIREFFGGANLAPLNTSLSTTIACGTIFDKVYGGSKKAAITGNVTLTVNGGTINEVYGGSEGTEGDAANINGNVTLNIYGGAIGNAFGGSNINGNITGTVTVNLDWSESDCPGKSINYIYGASNLATYTPSPKPEFSPIVNLINGTVNQSVFGAGKGDDDVQAAGKVTSNPKVNMSGASAWVKKNVYGGGEMATVDGNTYVNISNGIVGPNDLDPTDIDGHGDVFGGGLGKAGAEYSTFAFVTNANVTLSGGTVRGSVFGGGENGHVSNNTSVTVSGGVVGVRIPYAYRNISSDNGSGNPVYAGNVYGGGRGVDHTANGTSYSYTAGRVYGNTAVTVSGGQIHHSVYGGGSLASVGTYTLEAVDNIYGGHIHNFTANTGNATVTINGGRIGPTWAELLLDDAGNSLVDANGDALNAAAATTIANNYECLGENEGMVYGSGRGVNYTNDGNTDHQRFIEMAFTNNTTVTISGNADVVGSVFGGGENGHVKGNTQVNIQDGTIGGIPMHHNGFDLPGHEVGHGHIDDSNEDDDELGYNETGIGRSVFRGNVYGGGRGIDHTDGDVTESSAHIFSVSAGRVYGNTVVNVTGGHIYHNVFGGGSVASVGTYTYPSDGAGGYNFFANPEAAWNNTGATTVNVSGGQIGVMGENEGYVYGGGRGIAGTNETQVSHLAFVNSAEVNISQTNSTHADVRASVFGGGMNGHVLTNTVVNVSGGVIGGKTAANYGSGAESYDPDVFTAVPATVDYTINGVDYYSGIRPGDTLTTTEGLGPATVFLGNVYGGGRGVDVTSGSNLSYTAGRVYGNTAVNITGGVIYHSVFGGGSIASVGTYTTYTAEEAAHDSLDGYRILANQPKVCAEGTGNAVVTVRAGRIGTNGRNNGRVFGSSRGMAGTSYRGLGYVNRSHVTITGTAEVRGSVFGSGENGHVLDSTRVIISGGHIGNGKRTGVNAWMNNFIGNVYGGGRGLDRSNPASANTVSPFAGRVYRATYVEVTGGQIDQNVYGGGSLASVGRFKRDANGDIIDNDPDKGIARVIISGGTIGIDGDENGHVFGASRGTAVAYRESANDPRAQLAYVAGSRVNVSGGTIKGSVFGGGESGHVQRDARVSISGGEIGSTIPSDYTAMSASDKKKYDLMGNVYGAGRGIDEAHSGDNVGYSMSAGYVRGRTLVTITGTPTIHRNVYGGGSMGTVGDYGPYCRLDFWQGTPSEFARGTEANNYLDASNGVATVVIKGTVGTETDVARNYGGNVYGSCRGQANDPSHGADLDEFYDDNANHGFGEMAYVTGSHVVVETGANVWGSVYGGGENGHVDFGGTLVNILNGHVHGNVFGGGKGTSTSPTAGIVDGDATVNIGLPSQDGNTPDANGSYNTVEIDGNVFGGNDSYSSPLGTMTVNVYHTKHTAANKYPTLSNPVQASDTAGNNVESKYALKGVYGGGNLADVLTGIAAVDASDGDASHVYDKHYIDERINATNSNPAGYYPWPGGTSRKSVVNIYNCEENTIMYVYGGGRSAYTIEDEVNIYGGRIYQAYAGGDGRADPAYVGYLDGANLRTVPANNNHGKAVINIIGGIVNQVFGGCNTQGEVNGTSTVNFAQGPDCDILNSEVFGGNNQADMTRDKEVTIQCGSKWNDIYGGSNEADLVGNIILNIVGGSMNRAFGGSKNADIDGNVTVNVTGGSINELFGGNNVGGNITGTITVNVDCDPGNTCADERYLGTVYGGGKDAAYTPTSPTATPSVNIKCGTVSGDVFGGGLGSTANCTSNPKVLIGGDSGNKTVVVNGNVYGGGSAAPVTGSTAVETRSSNADSRTTTLRNNVYGGGLGATATVSADTDVKINGNGTLVSGSVYGGGNAGQVNGNTNVEIGEE